MKIELVGPSYQERSLLFDAQRTVNLYPVLDKKGADVAALYLTPGLNLLATIGSGPIRGGYKAGNGRVFFISGRAAYELFSNNTYNLLGLLQTSSGAVTIADNGFQLAICDGNKVYIFTYATNIFAVVSDTDIPSAGTIDFVSGYFVVTKNDTGQFYISALYDGTSWNPLDFATAESNPDKLYRATNFVGQLGLFGEKSLEIWRNTGDLTFPFSRISGSSTIGCISPFTILTLDTSVFWVGSNEQGTGIVYKAEGFTPVRISTSPIEIKLQAVANPAQLRAWTYQKDGHVFYAISGSDLETTLVYDISTELWHERAYLNSFGAYEQHRASCVIFAFGKILAGDRESGNIYEMSQDYYDDSGHSIAWKRIYTHLINELDPVRYGSLQIGFEVGVGTQTGLEPKAFLRCSQDGARTWSNYYSKSIGAVGKYKTQVKFRRLGIAQQMTFELSGSAPVKTAITGSYLN